MKKLFLTTTLLVIALVSFAQDNQEEFQRIAKRTMNTHDTEDTTFKNDSIGYSWHGGAYLGASSQGQSLPNGYFTFKHKKLVLTGDFVGDFLEKGLKKTEHSLSQDIDNFTNNAIEKKSEAVKTSLRLDYYPQDYNCYSIGLLEDFKHEKTNEDAVTTYYNLDGSMKNNDLNSQSTNRKYQKMGWLLQWKHKFDDNAMLMVRSNIKYHTLITTANQTKWDTDHNPSINKAEEDSKVFNPYGQVQYDSRKWGGFKFSVVDKFMYNNLNVDELTTSFRYRYTNNIATLKLNYADKHLSAYANGWYDAFHHSIDQEKKNYNDWLMKAGIGYKLNKTHSLQLSYNSFITRPTYTQLYYHRHIGSTIGTYYIGNKDLDPSYTYQYKIAYTFAPKNLNVDLGMMFERINDDITKVSTVDDDGQTCKTWVNDAKYRNLNLTMDGKWLWGCLDLRWHVKAKRMHYDSRHKNNDRAWSWSFKVRPEVSLGSGWKVAGAVYYIGKEMHATYYHDPYTYVSVRGVRDFGKWSIYALFQDIFEQHRVETTRSQTTRVVTNEDLNARALIVGFSYTF